MPGKLPETMPYPLPESLPEIPPSTLSRIRLLASLATDDERTGAEWFYLEAHRFCAWLAGAACIPLPSACVLVAVLSPRNSWQGNQQDAIELALTREDARRLLGGNDPTLHAMPRDIARAREIVEEGLGLDPGAYSRSDLTRVPFDIPSNSSTDNPSGNGSGPSNPTEDGPSNPTDFPYTPLASAVLSDRRGRKIGAFARNLLSPSFLDAGLPIDRHIARALYGLSLSDSAITRALASRTAYTRAEALLSAAAALLSPPLPPLTLASLLWLVVRRLVLSRGQHSLPCAPHPSPWRPMLPGASYALKRGHFRQSPALSLLPGCPWRPWLLDPPQPATSSYPGPRFGHEHADERGRVRVTLGVEHPHSNSRGWQYRYRLVAQYALIRSGSDLRITRPGHSDLHVDHRNVDLADDRLDNLRVVESEWHGGRHARMTEIAGGWERDEGGRFVARRGIEAS